MPWLKTGSTFYHAQLGHPHKDCAIKEKVVKIARFWDYARVKQAQLIYHALLELSDKCRTIKEMLGRLNKK